MRGLGLELAFELQLSLAMDCFLMTARSVSFHTFSRVCFRQIIVRIWILRGIPSRDSHSAYICFSLSRGIPPRDDLLIRSEEAISQHSLRTTTRVIPHDYENRAIGQKK